jgi:hypothetical protein
MGQGGRPAAVMTHKPQKSFPGPADFFYTRLSDGRPAELASPGRVGSLIAIRAMDDGRIMSQKSRIALSRGIVGMFAVALTFGAAQFASGRDLGGSQQAPLSPSLSEATINRAAKADRAAGVAGQVAQTRTVLLRLTGLPDTSVLLRVPLVEEARNGSSSLRKSGDRKTTVACEPVVSVLTEVAKQLEPGRCVT